jgi:hypothetical protein
MFIFYFNLNFFSILTFVCLSHDFFNRFSIFYHLCLFTSLSISYYLFLTLSKDPGILAKKGIINEGTNINEINLDISSQNIINNDSEKLQNTNEEHDVLDNLIFPANVCLKCQINIVK